MKTDRAEKAGRFPISRYLNTRYAYWPGISSDGRRVAFITDITGVPQAWQVAYDREAEQLVTALTARGVSVEFIVFDDEGHGIAKLKNKLVAYPAIAGFLDRVLQVEQTMDNFSPTHLHDR